MELYCNNHIDGKKVKMLYSGTHYDYQCPRCGRTSKMLSDKMRYYYPSLTKDRLDKNDESVV